MSDIDKLKEIIKNSKKIVCLTGAGISTESGIKDFRGKDGISNYNDIPIEVLLSHDYYENHTSEFFDYYRKCFDVLDKEPNVTHKFLKRLEDEGKLVGIITQNVDGLHSKAGNKKVIELHGSIYHNYCTDCGKEYSPEDVFKCKGIPTCKCGGIIKPSVVLYGEPLPGDEIWKANKATDEADTMIVLGTSLVVMPASMYAANFNGEHLVIINLDSTPYDSYADVVIHDKLSNVISKL